MALEIIYKNITNLSLEERDFISNLENLYRIDEAILYVKSRIGEKKIDFILLDKKEE